MAPWRRPTILLLRELWDRPLVQAFDLNIMRLKNGKPITNWYKKTVGEVHLELFGGHKWRVWLGCLIGGPVGYLGYYLAQRRK